MSARLSYVRTLGAVFVLSGSTLVHANTWTNGGGDNLWSNPANWDSDGTSGTLYIPRVFDNTATGSATAYFPAEEYYPKASTITFSRSGGFTIGPVSTGIFFLSEKVEVTTANENYAMPGFIYGGGPTPLSIDVATGSRLTVTGLISTGGAMIDFTGAGTFEYRQTSSNTLPGIDVNGGVLQFHNTTYVYSVGAITGTGLIKSTGNIGMAIDPNQLDFTGRIETLADGSGEGAMGFSATGTADATGVEFFIANDGTFKSRYSVTVSNGTISGGGILSFNDGNAEYGSATKLTMQGAQWRPGNGAGTAGLQTVRGNLGFAKNAGVNTKLHLEIVDDGTTAGTDYDQIQMIRTGFQSGGLISSDSNVNNPLADVDLVLSAASLLEGTDLTGNTYVLIQGGFWQDLSTASFGSVTFEGLTGTINYNPETVTLTGVTVVPVPEPASLATLAVAAMALIRRRRF